MKKRIGVVADDVTGANDIGVMFKKGGFRSAVFPQSFISLCDIRRESEGLDVIIIDTDSRFDAPETAASKVAKATALLQTLPCDVYFNKTCSVFRGNIGSEFDSMQDVLGVGCSMVIAGFPGNGRTTVDGIHYVYGTRLEDSQFRTDPIHPMDCSFLPDIMHRQTDRPIGQITWSDLDQGLEFVKRKKEELKRSCAYILFDIRHQEDLRLVADAVADEVNICGSSAIGQELPAAYRRLEPEKEVPVLLITGSLTKQSISQTELLRRKGYPIFTFDTETIFDEKALAAEERRLTESAVNALSGSNSSNAMVLVHSVQEKEKVRRTKETGQKLGLTHEEIGKRISGCLCRVARSVLVRTGCRRLVVAGGDTSAAVTGELEIYRMEIGEEIEPGVPAMTGTANLGELQLVLKSGSFGSEFFLEKAARYLQGERAYDCKQED